MNSSMASIVCLFRYFILLVASCHVVVSAESEYTSCIIVCRIEYINICPSETPNILNKRQDTAKRNCTELHKQCKNKCGFRKYCRGIKFKLPHCMGAYPSLRKAMMSKSNTKATATGHLLMRRARNPVLKDILRTDPEDLETQLESKATKELRQ